MTDTTRSNWRDIRDAIHKQIMDSTYGPGEKLPKDEEIAEELNCARATVQRAMKELADKGVVERKRKGGTRVRHNPFTRATIDIPVTRIEVEQRGSEYGYQLISKEHAEIPLAISAKFGLNGTQEMLRVKALHMSDRRPYIFEERWISTTTVPEIVDIPLDEISANEWLVRNKPYNKFDIQIFAERAGSYFADLFEVDENTAMMVIERTTWQGRDPITFVKAITMPGYRLVASA